MSRTLAEVLTLDLLNAIADAPIRFTYDNAIYEGTQGGINTTERNFEGGILAEPDLVIATTLKVKQGAIFENRFTDGEPQPNETLESVNGVNGADYRIEKVTKDELGTSIQFDLMSKHKEAR